MPRGTANKANAQVVKGSPQSGDQRFRDQSRPRKQLTLTCEEQPARVLSGATTLPGLIAGGLDRALQAV
jgi:hypothetical protein